jgi:hypothetical protein
VLAAGATAARPKTVKVAAAIVYRTGKFPAKNDPNRCLGVAFAQFSSAKGAKLYTVLVRGFKGSSNVTGGGPPFPQDTYKVTSGKKTITFRVPSGKHWFVLGTASTGEGCPASLEGLKGRFKITRATANV